MTMEARLPFERGTYTCGTVEVGAEFYDPKNKQWLQIAKNTDTAAALPKRVHKWETPASYESDLAVAEADGPMAAGVVDPQLAAAGAPVNSFFYLVTAGVVTAAVGSGSDTAAGGLVTIASTAIGANEGKVHGAAAVTGTLTGALNDTRNIVGVAHAAAAAASAAAVDVQIRLSLRR